MNSLKEARFFLPCQDSLFCFDASLKWLELVMISD